MMLAISLESSIAVPICDINSQPTASSSALPMTLPNFPGLPIKIFRTLH
jgi:hypothetical protein